MKKVNLLKYCTYSQAGVFVPYLSLYFPFSAMIIVNYFLLTTFI